MRIVFMGTPDFAVPCLQALIHAGHEVVAVFTQPDKPVGRKQIMTPSPVKACALENDIPVYQPERIKGSDTAEIIESLQPDVNVVVAYGKILPLDVLNAAKFGSINVHASLLPKYRGAAPIQWAVLNGDKESGVTVMQMDEGLDTGDMLLVKSLKVGENETSAALFERLSVLGAEALLECLSSLENGTVQPKKQPEGDFGYARMITKKDSPIDFTQPARKVHNHVRGLQTWPVATALLHGKTLKIHQTVLCDDVGGKPGEVMCSNKRLIVSCGDGRCVQVLELQLDGKKRMRADSFLLGNPIPVGTVLG